MQTPESKLHLKGMISMSPDTVASSQTQKSTRDVLRGRVVKTALQSRGRVIDSWLGG